MVCVGRLSEWEGLERFMHMSASNLHHSLSSVYLLSPAIAACNSNVKYLFTSVFEAALIGLWPLGGKEKKAKQA